MPDKRSIRELSYLANAVFVEGHADGGVHADFLEGGDLAGGGDASGGDNGKARGAAARIKQASALAESGSARFSAIRPSRRCNSAAQN